MCLAVFGNHLEATHPIKRLANMLLVGLAYHPQILQSKIEQRYNKMHSYSVT